MIEATRRRSAVVAFADRRIVLATGVDRPFEDDVVVERRAVDTQPLDTRAALRPLPIWMPMPPPPSPICDRVVFHAVRTLGFCCA